MNKLNYASLPASKKLVDNGILVREVKIWDRVHHITGKEGVVIQFDPLPVVCCKDGSMFRCDPRTLTILYSFTDVWRELPEGCSLNKLQTNYARCKMNIEFESENPTDALIDLLVWLKGEGK